MKKKLKGLSEQIEILEKFGDKPSKKLTDEDLTNFIGKGIKKFTAEIIDYGNDNGKSGSDKGLIITNIVVNTFSHCVLNIIKHHEWPVAKGRLFVKEHMDNLKQVLEQNFDKMEAKQKAAKKENEEEHECEHCKEGE